MRKRRAIIVGLGCLALVFSTTACGKEAEYSGQTVENQEGTGDEKKDGFGAFESETLDGEKVTEEIFQQADLTMVNIWATFCGPCIQEMPDLAQLSEEYQDKGVQIIGLIGDVGEAGNETAAVIIEETGADYTHIVASPGLQLGILNRISAYPTTVFVNKEGEFVDKAYAGARDKAAWAEIIDQLL